MATWYIYILRCVDGTLYTGITTDVDRRIREHNEGRGAKYTQSRTPVFLAYLEPSSNRSEASQRERAIKSLSRSKKLALIEKRHP